MRLKHNGGSYAKVIYCFFFGRYAKKNTSLQQGTLSGHHTTTGFSAFDPLSKGTLSPGSLQIYLTADYFLHGCKTMFTNNEASVGHTAPKLRHQPTPTTRTDHLERESQDLLFSPAVETHTRAQQSLQPVKENRMCSNIETHKKLEWILFHVLCQWPIVGVI